MNSDRDENPKEAARRRHGEHKDSSLDVGSSCGGVCGGAIYWCQFEPGLEQVEQDNRY